MSRSTWIVMLVTVALLVGCGSAAQPAPPKTPEPFMLALPRVEVTVDNTGNPRLFGLSPATFGMDAKLPKSLVDSLVAGDVQHIEARVVGDGLKLFANGKPLPYIGWNDEGLIQAADLAQAFTGQDLGAAKKLLPVLRRLGLDVVVRLPKKAGAAEIPLISLEEGAKTAPQPSGGPASAIVKMDLKLDDKGQPGILDVTAADLATLGMNMAPVLDQETLQRLQKANIQHLLVRTKPGGLYLFANGKPLPYLAWDARFLTNAAELYGQLAPDSPYRELINMVAPGLERADVDVLVNLPKAANAPVIPPPQR
jgi:hypothetical protein